MKVDERGALASRKRRARRRWVWKQKIVELELTVIRTLNIR